MYQEITVLPSVTMPRGYAFLPKGIAFKTLHCRKSTREAKMPLYVVVDDKRTLGLRAPKAIVSQVHQKADDTLSTRLAAVEKRDASDVAKTTTELKAQFPNMPAAERELVLKHGFKKHSRRVGRTASLTIQAKVRLAVIAHIRHKHTDYNDLLRAGATREDARVMISKNIDSVLREWGCAEGRSRHTGSRKATKNKRVAKRQRPREKLAVNRYNNNDSDSDSDYVP